MKKGPILTIIIVVILMYLIYMAIPAKYNQSSLRIGIPEARARRFGLIIDVRTPQERQQLGYYPNSIPISLERLRQEVPLDISNKNTWILVYCNTGRRAQMAAEILYKMGYPNVRYIDKSYLSLMPGSSY